MMRYYVTIKTGDISAFQRVNCVTFLSAFAYYLKKIYLSIRKLLSLKNFRNLKLKVIQENKKACQ